MIHVDIDGRTTYQKEFVKNFILDNLIVLFKTILNRHSKCANPHTWKNKVKLIAELVQQAVIKTGQIGSCSKHFVIIKLSLLGCKATNYRISVETWINVNYQWSNQFNWLSDQLNTFDHIQFPKDSYFGQFYDFHIISKFRNYKSSCWIS